MRKIFETLSIIQIKKQKDSLEHIWTKRRLNPYNPLTYLVIILTFIIGLLLFGFVGFWKEIDFRDLNFKYR